MSMKSPEFSVQSCVKSRFTGFFAFVLLSACQPLRDSQSELMAQAETEPAAAMRLAGQRLASGECWARRFAFTALHAGVEAEQLVPGKILGLFHAQGGLRVVQVKRFKTR